MAIRRTREQKERAELRRAESASFQWGVDEKSTSLPKSSSPVPKPIAAHHQQFLWKDLRRTATAILIGIAVLFGAWLAMR
jgi:hypothetical protein